MIIKSEKDLNVNHINEQTNLTKSKLLSRLKKHPELRQSEGRPEGRKEERHKLSASSEEMFNNLVLSKKNEKRAGSESKEIIVWPKSKCKKKRQYSEQDVALMRSKGYLNPIHMEKSMFFREEVTCFQDKTTPSRKMSAQQHKQTPITSHHSSFMDILPTPKSEQRNIDSREGRENNQQNQNQKQKQNQQINHNSENVHNNRKQQLIHHYQGGVRRLSQRRDKKLKDLVMKSSEDSDYDQEMLRAGSELDNVSVARSYNLSQFSHLRLLEENATEKDLGVEEQFYEQVRVMQRFKEINKQIK